MGNDLGTQRRDDGAVFYPENATVFNEDGTATMFHLAKDYRKPGDILRNPYDLTDEKFEVVSVGVGEKLLAKKL